MATGKRIIVRYSDQEYERILGAADAMGLNVSDYIRLAETSLAKAREAMLQDRESIRAVGTAPNSIIAEIPFVAADTDAAVGAYYAETNEIMAELPYQGAAPEAEEEEPDPASDFNEAELYDFDIPPPPGQQSTGRGPVRVGAPEPGDDYEEPEPSAQSIRRAPKKMGKDWTTPPDQRDYLRPNPVVR